MSEFLIKIKTVVVLSTAITIGSVSFISVANSAGKEKSSVRQVESQLFGSAKQQTSNSTDYSWGDPCNDYGPVGSVNVHPALGKRGPINPVACELAKKKMIRK